MITFKQFLIEAGASAGTQELAKITVEQARAYAEPVFKKHNRDLDKEIPNFEKNFKIAQNLARKGKTLRKDMPVLDQKDIKDFQTRLLKGALDINKPYHTEKDVKFLDAGLKVHDGSDIDDVVNVKLTQVTAANLIPIQRQVYFDKSINKIANEGSRASRQFVTSKILVISSDNRIIDGHHRFLSGILNDPTMKLKCLQIDLPLEKLLKVSLAYSDAVGNARNL